MVALSDALLAQLAERFSSRDVSALAPRPGGTSSLTYVGRCAGRPVVVKVAPPAVPPIAHHDVVTSHVSGTASKPLFDGDDCGSESLVAERFRNAAATMAQVHCLESGAAGLGLEPVIGLSAPQLRTNRQA